MDVILSGEERIVLKYVPKEDSELLLMHDGQYGAYLMLWHSEGMGEKAYEIQWRGDFKTTSKQFMIEVEEFESERLNEEARGNNAPNAPVDEVNDPIVPEWTV